ncbi:MAG: DUF5658 family protein [Thermosediminibacteraceae bacterium]|nr:DUF5658 family protein [Thermosediminibacteraceae bacterium]
MGKETIKDLKLLILLNAWDGIVSYIGVSTKNIEEWNPFMRNIVSNILLLIVVKIIIPTLIISLIILKIKSGVYCPRKVFRKLIRLTLCLYIAVSLIHALWIIKTYRLMAPAIVFIKLLYS